MELSGVQIFTYQRVKGWLSFFRFIFCRITKSNFDFATFNNPALLTSRNHAPRKYRGHRIDLNGLDFFSASTGCGNCQNARTRTSFKYTISLFNFFSNGIKKVKRSYLIFKTTQRIKSAQSCFYPESFTYTIQFLKGLCLILIRLALALDGAHEYIQVASLYLIFHLQIAPQYRVFDERFSKLLPFFSNKRLQLII